MDWKSENYCPKQHNIHSTNDRRGFPNHTTAYTSHRNEIVVEEGCKMMTN